jgi:uncharacterized protein
MLRVVLIVAIVVAVLVILLALGCSSLERKLLFYPSHRPATGPASWTGADGKVIGYARTVAAPKNVWLLLHGNGGQASDRAYALPRFAAEDAVFILEYPGYGDRPGAPSRTSFNAAAREAYLLLKKTYPQIPVCVAGESIGTGPSCSLAALDQPPAKIVLVVPFARLSAVAREHFPAFLVKLALKSDWDNVAALAGYKGPVDIFGAQGDTIIPVHHARTLAAGVPSAKLTIIDGGHNEWSHSPLVQIRNP